ncbi:MAG: 16S rRNA (adenine(1518)-N(6)/adenine(1519)-N(6))-dimethyltransferase RsmA [Gammaproteobacteria bacterium]
MSHVPRKRFGQNFLHDPKVIAHIVQAIDPRPEQQLVEIGPGQGAITEPLLRACGHLDVVEIDRDLAGSLHGRWSDLGTLTVHNQDALKLDFCSLADPPGRRLRIVGNLPYNISTPLLFHALEQLHCIQDMHFMLQKEVVDRMAAKAGDEAYGRLSVMVQYHCTVEPLFTIGPGAFRPPPRVESAFVMLAPHDRRPVQVTDEACFARVVREAFSHRRKTLRNALRGMIDESRIIALGLDPGLRPERLGLEAFAALANAIADDDFSTQPC